MGRGGGDDDDDDDRERSRKRRISPSTHSPSPRRDEKSGKRKRRRDEDERDRRKDKKHSKTQKSSRSQDEKGAEGSSKEKKHKKSRKSSHSLQIEKLSSNDYFLKNNEFSAWLKEEKGIFFSDLSSTEARELFSNFVKDWNKGKLQSQYYEGISRGQDCPQLELCSDQAGTIQIDQLKRRATKPSFLFDRISK